MNLGCVVKANRCSESQRRWLVLRLPFVEQKNTSAYCTLLEAGWAGAGESAESQKRFRCRDSNPGLSGESRVSPARLQRMVEKGYNGANKFFVLVLYCYLSLNRQTTRRGNLIQLKRSGTKAVWGIAISLGRAGSEPGSVPACLVLCAYVAFRRADVMCIWQSASSGEVKRRDRRCL